MILRLTGKRDRLIGCVEKESILGKDISTCLPVSLNTTTQANRNLKRGVFFGRLVRS